MQKNTLEWVDQYQVFGSNEFKSGSLVEAATENVAIQFGIIFTFS